MRAGVLFGRKDIRPAEQAEPSPAKGEVLIEVAFASICGTDHHIWLGEFEERVRYPAVPGHEFSGRVVALGENVDAPAVGTPVAVDPLVHCGACAACRTGQTSACRSLKLKGVDEPGGFGKLVAVPAAQVFALPEGLGLKHAALAELYTVAVHAAGRGRAAPGEAVAIFGAGKLGSVVLDVLAATGPRALVALDLVPERLERAKTLGATHVLDVREPGTPGALREIAGGEGVDLAFECVGAPDPDAKGPDPVAAALDALRHGGRAVTMGQGTNVTRVALRPFVWKEAELVASRVSRGEMPRALAMLAGGRLHPEAMITHEYELESVAGAYARVDGDRAGALKVLVRHGEER